MCLGFFAVEELIHPAAHFEHLSFFSVWLAEWTFAGLRCCIPGRCWRNFRGRFQRKNYRINLKSANLNLKVKHWFFQINFGKKPSVKPLIWMKSNRTRRHICVPWSHISDGQYDQMHCFCSIWYNGCLFYLSIDGYQFWVSWIVFYWLSHTEHVCFGKRRVKLTSYFCSCRAQFCIFQFNLILPLVWFLYQGLAKCF